MRRHPHLYEINTWPWLERLSRRHGRRLTLGSVPGEEWDGLRARGMDFVYLMGLWRRSAIGRQIARSDPSLFGSYDRAYPAWRMTDVVGSAFSSSGYEPDPRIGTMAELDALRTALHARDLRLIVDFIPNHVAFDHPWISAHPDRFVTGSQEAFRQAPSAFRVVELPSGDVRLIACARDPYFPPWSDLAQLDYSREDTRRAMLDELRHVAAHADGVRCDMAMLVLPEIFATTWRGLAASSESGWEFWSDARAALPDCALIAEVYWDLEWRLQQIGFDYTYDKRLYDRLLHGSADAVRQHLLATEDYQGRSARFVENHDEPPSAIEFGERAPAAAVTMSTLQGMRFYHDGQWEGCRERLPVQLGRGADEPADERSAMFYRRLLEIVDAPIFHEGTWALSDVRALDPTSANLTAWRWTLGDALRIVVVNLGDVASQGQVGVDDAVLPAGQTMVFEDLLDGQRYEWNRGELTGGGLYVRLQIGQAHIFAVTPR